MPSSPKLTTSAQTDPARRHPAHQRRLHDGQPPEPYDLYPADTLPIFFEGELVGFASSRARWVDVGGVLGGATGHLQRRPAGVYRGRFFKAGVQDEELTRMIKANIRLSDLAMGDLRAQIAFGVGDLGQVGLIAQGGSSPAIAGRVRRSASSPPWRGALGRADRYSLVAGGPSSIN